MCIARRGVEEITDACAVTIASFWQSSGWSGKHFAALASGAECDVEGLRSNIHYAYTEDVPTLNVNEQLPAKLALDMLATWSLAKEASVCDERVAATMAKYREIVSGNDAETAVAHDNDGLMGVWGEVLETAHDLGYDIGDDEDVFKDALVRAARAYQAELKELYPL